MATSVHHSVTPRTAKGKTVDEDDSIKAVRLRTEFSTGVTRILPVKFFRLRTQTSIYCGIINDASLP
jgi:hypothetical protein